MAKENKQLQNEMIRQIPSPVQDKGNDDQSAFDRDFFGHWSFSTTIFTVRNVIGLFWPLALVGEDDDNDKNIDDGDDNDIDVDDVDDVDGVSNFFFNAQCFAAIFFRRYIFSKLTFMKTFR